MKYKIIFLPQANRDIASLADILAPYPSKAKRLFQEMEQKLELLKDNPLACPLYHASTKYHRMSLEGHALFYAVDEDKRELRVYRVLYAKRDIPRLLEDYLVGLRSRSDRFINSLFESAMYRTRATTMELNPFCT